MVSEVEIHIHEKTDRAVIEIHGELNEKFEEKIITSFDNFSQKQKQNCILDLSKIEYINSAGFSIIIQLIKKNLVQQRKIKIAGLDKYFQNILASLGIAEYIQFYNNIDLAIKK
ncbi:MAG: STAS domain-containing protein [Spirochaetia bacterium]|nr:STAS domain-containing protein [Spirochaetia bacterium]